MNRKYAVTLFILVAFSFSALAEDEFPTNAELNAIPHGRTLLKGPPQTISVGELAKRKHHRKGGKRHIRAKGQGQG